MAEQWHAEIFETAEQLASFMNHVSLQREQVVDIAFHALSPTALRILLTCRLNDEQRAARTQWQAVERTLHPAAAAVTAGGGH